MRRFWTTVGALCGGAVKGWKGAALGAALGYGLDCWLEAPLQPAGERLSEGEEVSEPRHPEEEILDAMRQAESEPAAGSGEMAAFFRDVVGTHPAGLVAAEIAATKKG
jgi:hypothetical protein